MKGSAADRESFNRENSYKTTGEYRRIYSLRDNRGAAESTATGIRRRDPKKGATRRRGGQLEELRDAALHEN